MTLPLPLNPVSLAPKWALAAARRTGEHYRLIFETTFRFIGLPDTQGVMLEVNRTALDWVPTPREDVVGQLVWTTPLWVNAGDAILDDRLDSRMQSDYGALLRLLKPANDIHRTEPGELLNRTVR